MTPLPGPIEVVLIVVPARNEQQRLPACLAALARARDEVRADPTGLGSASPRLRTLVVLDRCTDATPAIAAGHPEVETVLSTAGRVGAARALGVLRGLSSESVDRQRIWIASTDADSCVPASWLSHQLDLAARGADVFRGLVDPNPNECGPGTYDVWARGYDRRDGHGHVHGANLGIRADAYVRCGGFDIAAEAHEDVRLTMAAERLALTVVASAAASVATSGRLIGRVAGAGFADHLVRCATS